jgi:hypothetical protein
MLERGHFLPGGTLLGDAGGVNETYRGIVELANRRLPAYVKLLDRQQLCNEIVAYELARQAQLKIPQAFLVLVCRGDYPESRFLQAAGADVFGFASADSGLQDARKLELRTSRALSTFLSSWKEWPEVAAFDDWIANADRHPGNLLVGGVGDVWVVDHSHAFTGCAWCVGDLIPDRKCSNQICSAASGCLKIPEKYVAFSRVLGQQYVYKNIDPVMAISSAADLIGEDEQGALVNFLQLRIPSIQERVAQMLGIPMLVSGALA